MNPNNDNDSNIPIPPNDPSVEPDTQADQPFQADTTPDTPETFDTPDVPANATPDTDSAPMVEPTVAPVEAEGAPTTAPATPPVPADQPSSPMQSSSSFNQSAPSTSNNDASIPPVAAAAPVVSATTPNSTPPSKPSNAKKAILIAAIVGGLAFLVVIAVIVYTLLTSVSKEDYRAAVTQFNEVSSANRSLTSDVARLGSTISTATDEKFEQGISDAEAAITKIKAENEALGELKAVRVGDGAELYDTFDDKLEGYLKYANDIVTSVKNVRPALVTCSDMGDGTDNAARVTALKECSDSLGKVTDIPNAEFKEFIGVLKTGYADYATIYEDMSALSNPFGAQYEEYKVLRDKLTVTQRSITAASRDFSDKLEKRDDQLAVKPAADALADYLRDQQQ